MRWLWFAAGWLMVALGFIGAMLPVMPTSIFLIMAVGCFARSSPRFERWLLGIRSSVDRCASGAKRGPSVARGGAWPLPAWRQAMSSSGSGRGHPGCWRWAWAFSLCWVRPTWARGRCRDRSGSPATRAHGSGGRRFPYFSSYFVMEILPLSYSARKTSLASSIPCFLSSAFSQSSSLSIISSVLS